MGSKMLQIVLENSTYQAVPSTGARPGTFLMLGMDTELLLRTPKGEVVFPHQIGMPQERPAPTEPPLSSVWKGYYGDWHGDGYAAELCVTPFNCIDRGMAWISNTLGHLRLKRGGVVDAIAGFEIDVPVIYSVPEEVVKGAPEQVRMLGCMPSFSVYNEEANPSALGENERTTGFHMHMSNPWLNSERADTAIKWADIYCGSIWTLIAPTDPKAEARRRQCYGRAGEHRKNIYPSREFGFEYRVLPGTVLSHPVYTSMMFSLFRHAFHAARLAEPPTELTQMARVAINEADRVVALELMKQLPMTDSSSLLVRRLIECTLEPLSTDSLITALAAGIGHQKFILAPTLYNLKPR